MRSFFDYPTLAAPRGRCVAAGRAATALLAAALLASSPLALAAQSRAPLGPITPAEVMAHATVLAADSLEGRLINTPGSAKARAYVVRQFERAGLTRVGASFEHPFERLNLRDSSKTPGVNIVGLVRGTVYPDRYIVVTAHYDHVGIRSGEIYNGADDNASGTSAIIEIARRFVAQPGTHSVLFVAFDGEEGGLAGARAFVDNPPIPKSAIAVNVNLDMVGRNTKNELYAAGTWHTPTLRPLLEPVAKTAPITLLFGHDDPTGPRRDDWTGQSDQGAFHRAGIPFVYFGVEDHPDYHRPTDDAERLMPEFFAGAANTVLAAVRAIDAGLDDVRTVSFNIRYGTALDGDHVWPNRREHVISTIKTLAPHILGVQEALDFQIKELDSVLVRHTVIGVGRDDGATQGEYAAIYVDTARFHVLSSGTFWLSVTPEVVASKSWGNNITRITTMVRLHDRLTGDTVRVYNAHFDHESQPSRERSAQLVKQRVARDGSPRDRVIVLGDLNADESNPAIQAFLSPGEPRLIDPFRALHPDARMVGTFNAFRGDSAGGKIDHIFTGPGWTPVAAGIDRTQFGPPWASDHFAVWAVVRRTPGD
jgi:endonuclease/exonuclease/phosphatase family metal-dependent hydrolase